MRNLLLRDWKLHKDALLLFGIIVVLLAPVGYLLPPQKEESFLVLLLGRAAFGLGCLLPFLVHFREIQQGTLGDLLALPIARRDLVKLRWLQALMCATGLFLIVTLPSLHHLSVRDLMRAHATYTLPWIFLWIFAAQLPFQLRFGQKGGLSFGLTLFLIEGWGFANMPAKELANSPVLVQKILHLLQAPLRFWSALGDAAPYAEAILLGLLIWAAFRVAILAVERCDA